ncbi:hypothetical protein EDD15DRAFT_2375597 [Pisolithus albus]|nr:hypothetical protein EDD15DRAFT_2375597 [Pisolithus albus]
MSLAIPRSLHIRSGGAPAAGSFDFLASFLPRLPLPGDAIEEQELIYVGSPDVGSTVSTAVYWPDASKDGSCASHGANRNPISQFLPAQCFRTEGGTLLGLQTRASTLLGEAHSVTAAYYRSEYPSISHSASFCSRFTTLDNPIQNFFNSLPHPATSSRSPRTGGAYASQQMFLVVNLAALSQITLRCPLALLHVPSNKVCVETAVRAVRALNGIENPKIMNPIRVTSWGVFFFTLQGELGRLRSRPWQGNGFASTGRGPNEIQIPTLDRMKWCRLRHWLPSLQLRLAGAPDDRSPQTAFNALFLIQQPGGEYKRENPGESLGNTVTDVWGIASGFWGGLSFILRSSLFVMCCLAGLLVLMRRQNLRSASDLRTFKP